MKHAVIMNKEPRQLMTPNGLGEKARHAVTEVVNPLVADIFALFVKTKNFHWHMTGSHYRDYHLLLDEHSDQLFAMIDVLAERVRKMGGMTIRSIEHIKSLQHIQDEREVSLSAKEMLKRLMNDNQLLAQHLREAHAVCDEVNDVATASFLEVYIDETEKRVWFLFETISE